MTASRFLSLNDVAILPHEKEITTMVGCECCRVKVKRRYESASDLVNAFGWEWKPRHHRRFVAHASIFRLPEYQVFAPPS
jgi:hypothetical protein